MGTQYNTALDDPNGDLSDLLKEIERFCIISIERST